MVASLTRASLPLVLLAGSPGLASAHFLWIVAGPHSPDGKIHVYFSEDATPDDPDLLDRLGELTVRQRVDGRLAELKAIRGKDSLVADPGDAKPPLVALSHSFGVVSRGGSTFLLKYHAKCLTSPKPGEWLAVAGSEALPLEIVPRFDGEQVAIRATFLGKPVAGGDVVIALEGADDVKGTTDARGELAFRLPAEKRASIRVRHIEPSKGELDGKSYDEVRHYATLVLSLATDARPSLPQLDPPVTSFGAAVVGSDVYVAGGHLGGAHHYSADDHSRQLRRLNLDKPTAWASVGTLPGRTGTALVAHDGRLYRVGGFVARNAASEKQDLVSTTDFARFDPATGRWEDLAPLPKGRSSHDAVVIGDRLYVVGGWTLNGAEKTVWHETALVADLSQPKIDWKEIPVPFRRRALSAGEWKGKVVAVGGMQDDGNPTTATAVYDPEARTWSDGPSLQGEKMDGFGSSSFLCNGRLYASTYSGKLQRLSDDGKKWEVVGHLAQPRFFHRMLATPEGRLLVVGGASMTTGKSRDVELIDVMKDK